MRTAPPPPDIVDRLADHRTIGHAPRSELQWLADHGTTRFFEPGEYLLRRGEAIDESVFGLEVILSGRLAIYVDRGTGPRKVLEWRGGDVSGVLPFSRMSASPGDSVVEEPLETLSLRVSLLPELIRDCPVVTGACVHVMLDRARAFNTSDWQDEKMVSLGRLAAGIAHEMNNPASAVARSGQLLQESIEEIDRAVRSIALAGLTPAQLEAIESVRTACSRTVPPGSLSPLERADREDRIADWLTAHGADHSALESLVETAVTTEELDRLKEAISPPALDAALDWVAVGCSIRRLADENVRAATRISELVGAMKRLTYMDRAPAREAVHVEQGLHDALTILAPKIRAKSATIRVDLPADLPPVNVIGGELNQVWMNLIDNAVDAIEPRGSVVISAAREGRWLVVRVIDDGPGITAENRRRIFDPFFTTKPPGEGTGLGLEIARSRARANGGDIAFDSKPGRTEFRVSLPLPAD